MIFVKKTFAFGCLLFFSACQSATDLKPYGIDAKVDLPQDVTVAPSDIGLGVILQDGAAINLKVLPQGLNLSTYKAQLYQNKLNKIQNVYVDKPDVFLYESELAGTKESHFVANIKIGKNIYACRENTISKRFTKSEIEAMYALCKSLKAK